MDSLIPLCCLADVDPCAGVVVQRWFLLWLRAVLQFDLCDLQPPQQPSGGGHTPDVPASLLHCVCSHYGDGSVTQVLTRTHADAHEKT